MSSYTRSVISVYQLCVYQRLFALLLLESDVCSTGLRAIANLAYDDENRERLGQGSVCSVIVMLLNKHGLTNPFVAVAG